MAELLSCIVVFYQPMDYNSVTMRKQRTKKIYEYTAIFQEETEGGYSVWIPDLPGCASQGETIEEAIANIKEAITLYLKDTPDELSSALDYKRQFAVPVTVYV
jgi:predicted RNase H-like HicB family nuclease